MRDGQLARSTLTCYGAGSLIETSIYGFCGLYLLNFYTDVVQLDPRLVGYALFVCFAIDAVVDLPIGLISDATAHRIGRRRCLTPAACTGAVLFYLLLSPPAVSHAQQFVYLAVVSSLLFVSLSIYGIPYIALSWELSHDYQQRNRIAAYRRFFEMIGEILATMTIPVLMQAAASGDASEAEQESRFYPAAALLIGGISVIAAGCAHFGTQEPLRTARVAQVRFREVARAAFRNRPFVIVLATFTIVALADRVATALLLYLMEHLHGVPKDESASLFLAFFAGSLVSPPLWLIVTNRAGKKRAYAISIVAWGVAFGLFAAGAWSSIPLHVVAACMGVGSSGVFAIPEAIFPDAIEWDEHRTGLRKEASYASIARFTWQLATAAGFALVGELLAFIGYRGDEATGPDVLLGLRFVYVAVPAVLLVAALLVFRRYPLNADEHARLVSELDARRARESGSRKESGN